MYVYMLSQGYEPLMRQIEELSENGETVSDAAMQQTTSRTFPPLI